MGINYRELVGPLLSDKAEERRDAKRLLEQCFESKDVKPSEFDFGHLFANIFGFETWYRCKEDRGGNNISVIDDVFENAGAVATNAFQSISGQIVYNAIMDAYNTEELVFSKAIPTVQSPFRSEKIAGIANIGDEVGIVGEGEEYPLVGVSEDFIETPETKKSGNRIAITREAIFFDRTNVILDRCSKLGQWLGINREKRAINALIDYIPSNYNRNHRYKWRGQEYATFQASTPWANVKTTNPLVDWTSFQQAEQLLDQMTDPNTGEPFVVEPSDLIYPKPLNHVAMQILKATTLRTNVGGYATTGNLNSRESPNTVSQYTPYTSRYLRTQLAAAGQDTSTWFLGNIKEALAYMENWPVETRQLSANSQDEFMRDIVTQWRVSEMGTYAVMQPRMLIRCTP